MSDAIDTKSKYQCSHCELYKLPDFSAYKEGDMVMTFESQMNGNHVKQTCKEAKILHIHGDNVEIQFTNGKKTFFSLYALTPAGAPTGIDYQRLGRCKCQDAK